MFRSFDHHQGVFYFLAKITFINNTLDIPILKTGDVAASGIITPVGGRPVHRTAIYRCDDTRGCIIQF